jgi:hypothetical protein
MNVAILLGEDLAQYPVGDWVEGGAHRVFLLADRDAQTARMPECRRSRAPVFLFHGFMHNGLVERRILDLHERFGLQRVIALGESDVLRAARLRQRLGLPGQTLDSATAYRDKPTMKQWLRKSGVPTTPFRPLRSPLDLIEFHNEYSLPLFIKPRSAAGGQGVTALRSPRDLQRFLTRGFRPRILYSEYAEEYLVETFVEGRLYHVDGAVIDGKPALIVPSRYLAPDLPRCSCTLDRADPLHDRLVDLTARALRALPSPNDFSFHAEVFHTASGELWINEIAARTGGGQINAAVRVVSGLDLNRLTVVAQIDPRSARDQLAGARPQAPCAGFSLLSPPGTELVRLPPANVFPWISQLTVCVPLGYRTPPHVPPDPIATAVVHGGSASEVRQHLADFNEWFLKSFTRKAAAVRATTAQR